MFALDSLLWLILIPLLGSAWLRTGRPKWTSAQAGMRASLVMMVLWLAVLGQCVTLVKTSTPISQPLWQWFSVGDHHCTWTLYFDSITAIMTLLISTVGLLVHVYSMDYMKKDRQPVRYFGYLNLFIAMMMILVLSDGLILMFIGWEGVGLCSYLLIGYYNHDHANANAGKKAFLINRVGDLGLIVALMGLISILYPITQELGLSFEHMAQYADIVHHATLFSLPAATVIGVGLLIGVTGKSAQIPLYIWLPDAMAGPTPVSALIHAATMVTAGVYLLIRCAFVYELSSFAPDLVAWTGATTLLLAAMMAVFQKDIKKVLAYSTVSQLGYMVMACGLGGQSAALFHVWTHGFFKAVLFLSAGMVIHALGGQQDMDHMGGLAKKMPWTFACFLVGGFALIGLFPLAGFFSKDHILLYAWASNKALFTFAMLGVVFTAFYTVRMLCMTFGGTYRGQQTSIQEKGHAPMMVPMVCLAMATLVTGWLWTPHYLGHVQHFYFWVTSSVSVAPSYLYLETWEELVVGMGAMLLSLLGMSLAWMFYRRGQLGDQRIARRFPDTYELLFHRFYTDELYDRAFVYQEEPSSARITQEKPVTSSVFRNLSIGKGLFDRYAIDGLVHWFALVPQMMGGIYTRIQNGQIQNYVRWITLGAMSMLLYWFAYRSGGQG